jgi:hypothetical protein
MRVPGYHACRVVIDDLKHLPGVTDGVGKRLDGAQQRLLCRVALRLCEALVLAAAQEHRLDVVERLDVHLAAGQAVLQRQLLMRQQLGRLRVSERGSVELPLGVPWCVPRSTQQGE